MAHNSSFLPEDYLEKRIARRTNAICLALFVVVMVSVVAAFFVTGRQHREARSEQQAVNARFEEAARRLEQLDELRTRKQWMIQKAKVTGVLVERIPRPLVLSELINHMPSSMGLLELELETEILRNAPRPRTSMEREKRSRSARKKKEAETESAAVEVASTKLSLSLVGLAPTDVEVAQFMTALSNLELFNDLNLQYSEQSLVQDREVRKFQIDMTVNQDIDLSKIEPTKVARELKQNPMGNTIQIDAEDGLVAPVSDNLRP